MSSYKRSIKPGSNHLAVSSPSSAKMTTDRYWPKAVV